MQGNIDFTGSLSGSIAGGGGGSSDVTITPTLQSGTKIADYTIDDTPGVLYAPTPTSLTAELPLSISENTISIDLSNYATQSDISDFVTGTELATVLEDYPTYTYTESRYTPLASFNAYTIAAESHFQRTLTAGANITIDPTTDTISASVSSLNINNIPTIIGKWDTDDLYCVKYTITPSASGDYVLDNNFGNDKTLRLYDVSMRGLTNQMAKFSSSIDDTLYIDSGELKYYINKGGTWWAALNTLDIIVLYT